MNPKKFLITAGPTLEAIDPVRFISNHSSGKMGFALALAAKMRGYRVTLISGPVKLATPPEVQRIDVTSAQDMYDSVFQKINDIDIFISVAAVSDYRPANPSTQKLKKTGQTLNLTLIENPDILRSISCLENKPFTVGFAAETDHLIKNARIKLKNKKCDLLFANRVGASNGGFESELNAVTAVWNSGEKTFALKDKTTLADEMMNLIDERWHKYANAQILNL